ncbi:Uncharacterised protein [Chlamydia trachomatis]|nr:Uncharacterised protein [Chlamydia trachomatis]
MINTLPCVMNLVILKNQKLLWIWRQSLVVMNVLTGAWMTWKCLMKSMPARLRLKWTLMVSKSLGSLCSKMKLTTTRQKSNHLVVLQLVSVEPFVTRCQGVLMFTKLCVSQELETSRLQSHRRVLVNCLNKSSLKQRRMAILHMVTKSVLQQLMCASISTQVLSLSVWSLVLLSALLLRKMLSVKNQRLVMWLSSSVGKQVVTVSVVRPVLLRFKRLSLWKQLALKSKKGMLSKNVKFSVFSAMAM